MLKPPWNLLLQQWLVAVKKLTLREDLKRYIWNSLEMVFQGIWRGKYEIVMRISSPSLATTSTTTSQPYQSFTTIYRSHNHLHHFPSTSTTSAATTAFQHHLHTPSEYHSQCLASTSNATTTTDRLDCHLHPPPPYVAAQTLIMFQNSIFWMLPLSVYTS